MCAGAWYVFGTSKPHSGTLWCVFSVGLIEIIARIKIVLAADLRPILFIPGSDFQDFTIDNLSASSFASVFPENEDEIWNT